MPCGGLPELLGRSPRRTHLACHRVPSPEASSIVGGRRDRCCGRGRHPPPLPRGEVAHRDHRHPARPPPHHRAARAFPGRARPQSVTVAGPSWRTRTCPLIVEKLEKYPALCASRLLRDGRGRDTPAGPTTSAHRRPLSTPSPSTRPTCACARCSASRRRSTGGTSAPLTIGAAVRSSGPSSWC